MAKRKLKLRSRDIAPMPKDDGKAERVLARLDEIKRDIAGIPEPDLGPVRKEVDALRSEVEQIAGKIPKPQEWKFDIRRRDGKIIEVNAVPVGEKAPARQANVFNLYKEND